MDEIYNEDDDINNMEEKSDTRSLFQFKYPIYIVQNSLNLLHFKNKTEFGCNIELMCKDFGIPVETSMEQIFQCLVSANELHKPRIGVNPTVDVYRWNELLLLKLVKG